LRSLRIAGSISFQAAEIFEQGAIDWIKAFGLRWKMSPAADKREADDDQRDTQSIVAR
jgi:hypothetical protein